ncbi:MAG: GNAT family N-acetyltransferase [Thermomicrobiales bacterium]|nr:GNAT family N-acetyltransferase [Thermomicrobiales bacterium]
MADVTFRLAHAGDLDSIIRLLADDVLGSQRESAERGGREVYATAFQEILDDPRNELIVGVQGDQVVSVLQVTYIPGLSHMGAVRAQIESVRVASTLRGGGVGRQMFEWTIDRARQRGVRIVQLTTDQRRTDAHRWYRSLGFEATHVGMKLRLDPQTHSQG